MQKHLLLQKSCPVRFLQQEMEKRTDKASAI